MFVLHAYNIYRGPTIQTTHGTRRQLSTPDQIRLTVKVAVKAAKAAKVLQLSVCSREDARRNATREPAVAHAAFTENGLVFCLSCRVPRL